MAKENSSVHPAVMPGEVRDKWMYVCVILNASRHALVGPSLSYVMSDIALLGSNRFRPVE